MRKDTTGWEWLNLAESSLLILQGEDQKYELLAVPSGGNLGGYTMKQPKMSDLKKEIKALKKKVS